jgi:pimeloyl-ACP methyl ester carboxylesterase
MKKISHLSALALGAAISILSSAVYADPPMPPFYAAVAKMAPEGKLGQIIKQEKIATSVKGAQAWRVAYISSDISGRKTIATGMVVVPTGPAPAGGRPVMSWAHGTTGTAQNCGPSQVFDPAVPLNQYFLVGGNSWTDYGIPSIEDWIKEGYVIAATDYQGLGGGGKHQYGVSATNGMDAINAARAAGSMKEAGANKKAIVYGWSQGGGATIAAASMPDYIQQKGTAFDGLDILGFVALAPLDLAAAAPKGKITQAQADQYFAGTLKEFSNGVFNFSHAVMGYWGNQAAFPTLKLSDILTDEGVKVINEVLDNKCMHATADTLSYNYSTTFMNLVKKNPSNTLAWSEAFVKGSVAQVKPAAPVQIYFGSADITVPPPMHKAYQDQMCKLGGNVGRMQLPGAQDHYTTPPVSKQYYLQWIKDRVAGKPLSNACPQG